MTLLDIINLNGYRETSEKNANGVLMVYNKKEHHHLGRGLKNEIFLPL